MKAYIDLRWYLLILISLTHLDHLKIGMLYERCMNVVWTLYERCENVLLECESLKKAEERL